MIYMSIKLCIIEGVPADQSHAHKMITAVLGQAAADKLTVELLPECSKPPKT